METAKVKSTGKSGGHAAQRANETLARGAQAEGGVAGGPAAERDPARGAALKAAVSQIEKEFGQGSLMRLGDDAAAVSVSVIPTGALSIDLALGVGGVPRGRIVEIFGPESSGKTTLVYEIIAQAQKLGGICAFIDAEHAIDPAYARRIGVDIEELLVSQPDHGEQALEITDVLIRSGAVDVVAIDSVAALTPRAEIEGQIGDQQVGLQARLMSQALRKLAGNLNRANTVCVFTNQIREKVGVMFGSPETQPGGRALKFYASQRIDIRRIETLKEGTEAVGNRVRAKIVKNKVAPPFRQAEFDIEYGAGISSEGCLIDLGIEHGIVQKSGAFFSYDGERLGQGRNNAKAFLRENPALAGDIEQKIYAALGIERAGVPSVQKASKSAEAAEATEATEAAEPAEATEAAGASRTAGTAGAGEPSGNGRARAAEPAAKAA
jgi:recombination protein RecA